MMKLNTSYCLTLAIAAMAAGCASEPSQAPAAQPDALAAAAPTKCKNSAPVTGTTIVRRDCSSSSNAINVDPMELQDSLHAPAGKAPPGH